MSEQPNTIAVDIESSNGDFTMSLMELIRKERAMTFGRMQSNTRIGMLGLTPAHLNGGFKRGEISLVSAFSAISNPWPKSNLSWYIMQRQLERVREKRENVARGIFPTLHFLDEVHHPMDGYLRSPRLRALKQLPITIGLIHRPIGSDTDIPLAERLRRQVESDNCVVTMDRLQANAKNIRKKMFRNILLTARTSGKSIPYILDGNVMRVNVGTEGHIDHGAPIEIEYQMPFEGKKQSTDLRPSKGPRKRKG